MALAKHAAVERSSSPAEGVVFAQPQVAEHSSRSVSFTAHAAALKRSATCGPDTRAHAPDSVAELACNSHKSALQGFLHEISNLKQDVAGMEAVLETVKGYYNKRSTLGRRLPRLPRQLELRKRAQELVRLRQQNGISPDAARKKASEPSKHAIAPPDYVQFFLPEHACASTPAHLDAFCTLWIVRP